MKNQEIFKEIMTNAVQDTPVNIFISKYHEDLDRLPNNLAKIMNYVLSQFITDVMINRGNLPLKQIDIEKTVSNMVELLKNKAKEGESK